MSQSLALADAINPSMLLETSRQMTTSMFAAFLSAARADGETASRARTAPSTARARAVVNDRDILASTCFRRPRSEDRGNSGRPPAGPESLIDTPQLSRTDDHPQRCDNCPH